MPSAETIRKEIAACRRAGSECRFEDAVQAADGAIAMLDASSRKEGEGNEGKFIPLHAVALGYKGMALLRLKRFDSSVLALEESYRLFQEHSQTQTKGGRDNTSPMPLLKKVEACLVQVCGILQRSPPLPPLVKFPRTPHLFRPLHSKAVTDDDLVLSKDDSLFGLLAAPRRGGIGCGDRTETRISLEEKIDGANLGISLALDGEILVQNRSHYISHGEHAQFSPLAAWLEAHREGIRRILDPSTSTNGTANAAKRRILYGEWVVARHSIRYEKLPGYFIAFDVTEDGRFVSRRRFHDFLRGSGIPVAPTLDHPDMAGMDRDELEGMLMDVLRTPSRFRGDGGTLEGIVVRVDVGDWMRHKCKLVDPEFTGGIAGHWAKSRIEKQRIDADFASSYLESCYHYSVEEPNPLSGDVPSPRQRAVVSYREKDGQRSAVCSVLKRETPSLGKGSVVLPRNLCWLWPKEVLVSSTPKSREQIQAMHDALDIGLVITLTKEEPLPTEWFPGENCGNYFCPVIDGMPPTLQDMDDIGDAIVRTVSRGRAVLEHCGGGKGRAGTVAACLLLRFGRDGIRARVEDENDGRCAGRFLRSREPFMSGEDAIAEIRRRRPGSLETFVQESFVREYAQHLWRVAAANVEDPFDGLQIEEVGTVVNWGKTTKRRVPKYVILAGLPGSGKSSLAKQLSLGGNAGCSEEWVHASTDDMGKRVCCDVVGRVAAQVSQGRAGGIIVDACNINASKRKEWLDVMHRPSRDSAALVFFDVPAELCISRVHCRVDHPTIPFGRGGRVVESFVKNMELPTAKERDFFGQIVVLRSKDDYTSLLLSWGVTK